MSPTETAKILAVLAAAYPRFEVNQTTHAVWSDMLGDLAYADVNLAVRRHVSTSTWPPSIAEIRKATVPEGLSAAEAWGLLIGAIRRYGYYREDEAMDVLPAEVAHVARLVGWRDLNMSTEPDVIRGQFLRMFGQVSERERREALLPAQLRQGLERGGGLRLIGGGEEISA